MKGPGVKVRKERAEEVRRKLRKLGFLDPKRKAIKEGEYVIFPISPEAMGKLNGLEVVFREFPEIRKVENYKEIVKVPEDLRKYLPTSFDVIGDIAIFKIPEELEGYEEEIGEAMLKAYKSVKAVYVDRGVKGKYRVRKLEHVAGEERTETIFREYGVRFKVDVSKVYVSPRLGEEHKLLSEYVSEGEIVFDMFSGYGPFSIFSAKRGAFSYSSDINPYAIHYLYENCRLNKVEGRVLGILGDCRKVKGVKADHVIMNLPHSSKEFLDHAVKSLKEVGWIHIYVICEDPRKEVLEIREKLLNFGYWTLDAKVSGGKPYSPKESYYGIHLKLEKKDRAVPFSFPPADMRLGRKLAKNTFFSIPLALPKIWELSRSPPPLSSVDLLLFQKGSPQNRFHKRILRSFQSAIS